MPIRLSKTVKALLIICFALFVIQQTGDQFFGTQILSWLGLVPHYWLYDHRYWQIFTYSFLHGDVTHLFFNLLMIAFIGSDLELRWGQVRFLRYYFFCSISSGMVYLLVQSFTSGKTLYAPLIGASGAIYGMLMAYGLIFGERVLLFMMLFPMKAKHFIWVLALIQLMTSVYSPGGGWASLAHLSGMASGFFYLWIQASWLAAARERGQNKLFSSQKKKKRPKHLKLIVNNPSDFDSSDDDSEDNPKTWH